MNNVSASLFAIGMPSGMEWIWILLIILLLFGGAKLPSLAKGLGQSIREFKKASNTEDDSKTADSPAAVEPPKKSETTKTHGSN
jgi:sec-independent protein translocase protein TatA